MCDHTPHPVDQMGFTILEPCDLIVSAGPSSCSRTVNYTPSRELALWSISHISPVCVLHVVNE